MFHLTLTGVNISKHYKGENDDKKHHILLLFNKSIQCAQNSMLHVYLTYVTSHILNKVLSSLTVNMLQQTFTFKTNCYKGS